jgi:quercetin dioxygenase-like cupin family protein
MTLPRLLAPGEAPRVAVGGTPVSFLADGGDTANRLGVSEHRMPPRAPGAPAHFHRDMTEMFYVVSGEALLTLGPQRRTATAGSFMLVPANTPHAFANPSDRETVLLVMFTPDHGRERYFLELSELLAAPAPPSPELVEELARRYDQYPAREAG